MKKGIIIVPYMTGFGGTETVIKNLFEARLKEEQPFQLKVYSIGGSTDYHWAKNVDMDVKWISKKRKWRDLYAMTAMPFNILMYLKHEKPDFVISTNPVIWYLVKQCNKFLKKKVKVVGWYHYSIAQKPIKKLFLNAADYYLAISSGIKRQLVARGIAPERISLIYNPVVTDRHIIKRSADVHFVYLGRLMLDGQKNLRELMDALVNVTGTWTLDLYGSETQAGDLKAYAKNKNLTDHLVWHGFVSDPWNEIPSATALVLTSKYEGLPMVLCEAISHGIYCVSAKTSTGPEDIINIQNGRLYELGDTQKLTQILQGIVDGTVLPSQETIQKTANRFLPESYLERFNDAIKKILG